MAIKYLAISMEINPNYGVAEYFLGLTYLQTGNFQEAINAIDKALQFQGHNPIVMEGLALAHAVSGNVQEARSILVQIEDLAQKSYVSPYSFASIYMALGERERCLDLLESAIDQRERRIIHFHLHPQFDPLRSHPRYKALLRKMNLSSGKEE